ncbi:hypothetical protein AcW1_008259 [Taiwanofungus camphoratus]|nr:hypothetical protein AcV5_008555 [Antrodia cinnamomea]KAI0951146.1 hypothetical protein AcW1_008259 [Antrodia cinnamomea]
MTTTTTNFQPTATKIREKTKAKKRYLKAKKERRKKRKGLATTTDTVGGARGQDTSASKTGISDDSSEGHETGNESVALGEPEVDIPQEVKQDDARPRKRRKLEKSEHEADTAFDDAAAASAVYHSSPQIAVSPPSHRRSPTPLVALPSFALPSQPDAPSKSTLALQGLDKALIEAEIIDPDQVQTLPSPSDSADVVGLSEKTRKRLKELGISELFAVQTAVVPFLLSSDQLKALYLPYNPPRDVCVSAPTGSGKTLAYVLPIVEVLSKRIITRLRALVVLPTRDLVSQVRETFEAVAKGRGLKIGTVTGQHSFVHEQAQLVADKSLRIQGGSSKVDILICTPGRLIDHLNDTPNFSLQHLRYLVIDEADRLLAQSFQDWLAQVLAATRPQSAAELQERSSEPNTDNSSPHSAPHPVPYPDALSPAFSHLFHDVLHVRTDVDELKHTSCQKLLFSATLTRDPAQIAALHLHAPKYFIVQSQSENEATDEGGVLDLAVEKFSMPATLTEHMIVCESSQKPLMLFYLVHSRGVTNALVFTKSAESTARLVRLFGFFMSALAIMDDKDRDGRPVAVAQAYSSDLAPSERKSMLEKFKSQEIHILVCSDLISRGIDISHVSHVVNYDAPIDMRKYVHRVGRTARAGRAGDAWTLVEDQEARYFKSMLKNADHMDKIKRMRVADKDVMSLRPAYESALSQLKAVYARTTS